MENLPNKPKSTETNLDRRRFIMDTGVIGAAAAAGGYLYKNFDKEEDVESVENLEAENFQKETMGYMMASQLGSNEILFVDEDNVPIGSPIDFSDAIHADLKPYGVAISPPPLAWRREIARKLEADPANGGRKVARSHNVALVFKSVLNDTEEPELIEKVKSGEVKTFIDIVNYFAEKPVRGLDKKISRKDFVSQSVRLSKKVPDVVRNEIEGELKKVLPGLCAQESKFKNSLTSAVGAKGIFQVMPNIWSYYGRSEEEINSLKLQTEVAGELMSDIYRELMRLIDENSLLMARDLFVSKEEFLKDFIVPLMINSYNAGSKRLAAAVNSFFVPGRNIDGLSGKDVFLAMADFAQETETGILSRYRSDAREYVSRAYALSRVL